MENSVLLVRIYLPEIPRVPTTRPSREKKKYINTHMHHSLSFFLSLSLVLFRSFALSLSFFLSLFLSYTFPFLSSFPFFPSFSLFLLRTRKILFFLYLGFPGKREKWRSRGIPVFKGRFCISIFPDDVR